MPPVVAAAGISAGAGLLGGLIQSGANRSAQKSQDRANDQAVQLQREQMAEERRRYDAQQASYAQWYQQQMDIRRQIYRHYGYTLPGDEAAQAQNRPGKTSGAPTAGTMPGAGASGLTLGGIMGGQSQNLYDSQAGPAAGPMSPAPTPTPTPAPPGQTLGSMMGPNWSDWRNQNYG